jgi:peptidoglycan hydrolase-like protein with peptidoglycan-binding domain
LAVPTRTISTGLTGLDGADLQKRLVWLGFTVPAAEQQGSSFGQGTHDGTSQFQTAGGLPATGVVDPS